MSFHLLCSGGIHGPRFFPKWSGLLCLVICSVFYMSVGRRPALLITAAAVCISGAVNFALCAYVPHMIPLVWLGIFLCIWWIVVKRNTIFIADHAIARVGVLCGTWLVVGIVMLLFYWKAEPALSVISNTLYPGRRSSSSGTYPVTMLFSHFFSFWENQFRIPLPQVFTNICECAGFLWLAPMTVFCLRGLPDEHRQRRWAYWVVAVFGALLLVWLLLPLPKWLGRVTLMDKSGGGSRSMHVLGLVNVTLVALCLSFRKREAKRGVRDSAMLTAVVFATFYPLCLLGNISLGKFLTATEVALAAVYTTIVAVAVIEARFKLLVAAVLLPHIALFAFVNPVERGLAAVESVSLFQFIHSRPELLRSRWVVYSDTWMDSGFFTAVGCDVVTGLKYVPDLKALSLFDPTGAYPNVVNQSGLLIAQPEYGTAAPRFEQIQTGIVRWKVNPFTRAFRDIGVRYAAFRSGRRWRS